MKAISVKQPWAELIARGLKRVEFRSWRTIHRGPLLIVAGRQFDERGDGWLDCVPENLHYGKAIAIVRLEDVVRVDEKHRDEPGYAARLGLFAWELGNVIRLAEPFTVKGRLGLFNVTL